MPYNVFFEANRREIDAREFRRRNENFEKGVMMDVAPHFLVKNDAQ
jgi:hypothetical protein